MLAMHDHDGFKITVRGSDADPQVAVFDPRFPREPALHKTTSLDLAMKWIKGYRNGEAWTQGA